ncbi:MAG: hypothetical protein K8T10_15990 [Candidatus Eremiobacteraeota bacterium]|nr:hypothetical protein [Candidatus Eremiobacteraeota bacterium]
MKVSLQELEELLDYSPVICKMDPLSSIYLKNIELVDDDRFLVELDEPNFFHPPKRYLVKYPAQKLRKRFQVVELVHNPLTSEINPYLPENLDFIRQNCITNRTVSKYIKEYILKSSIQPNSIVLILVDGLSYEDVRDLECHIVPVFIDSASLTRESFPIITDKGFLPTYFVKQGFELLGFNYWDIEKTELSSNIFCCFSSEQVIPVDSFENILQFPSIKNKHRIFIQIVTMGLDQWTHKNYESPPIKTFINRITERIEKLSEIIPKPGYIFVISDHGILWKDKHQFQVIENKSKKPNPQMRYYCKNEVGRTGIPIGKEDNYWLLEYPYIRRNFRKNEWGCHGGLSFQESFVPLIIVEVK